MKNYRTNERMGQKETPIRIACLCVRMMRIYSGAHLAYKRRKQTKKKKKKTTTKKNVIQRNETKFGHFFWCVRYITVHCIDIPRLNDVEHVPHTVKSEAHAQYAKTFHSHTHTLCVIARREPEFMQTHLANNPQFDQMTF